MTRRDVIGYVLILIGLALAGWAAFRRRDHMILSGSIALLGFIAGIFAEAFLSKLETPRHARCRFCYEEHNQWAHEDREGWDK